MPYESPYPASVPSPSQPSAASGPDRRRRAVRHRALYVLALLALVIVPMQGSVGGVLAGAPAGLDAAKAASAPGRAGIVSLSLGAERVSTRQRAQARVVVSARAGSGATPSSAQTQALRSGRIEVVAQRTAQRKAPGRGGARAVHARLAGGVATVALPRLPAGTYRVRATLRGAGAAISSSRTTLRVLPAVRVRLAVAPATVAPGVAARASVRVSSTRGPARGTVRLAVRGPGGPHTVTARVRAGRAAVHLPALTTKGAYRVRAAFAGTRRLAPGSSAPAGLVVTGAATAGEETTGGTGSEPSAEVPSEKPRGTCLTSSTDPGGPDPWGGCWPGPNNTGLIDAGRLTPMSGDRTIKTDGQVVDGWDVSGCINVEALDVTIKNSRARCVTLSSGTRARYCHFGESGALRALTECTVVPGLSDDSDPATNDPRLRIQDSEIDCRGVPGRTGTGIGDRNMTVVRVDVHGCENGFDADSYMTIVDSYIHDLYNGVEGDPHTDGLQSGVGAHLVLSHNVFYAFTPPCAWPNNGSCNGTAAINIGGQRSQATSSSTTVSRNLLAGGAYTMYCPFNAAPGFRITENYFSEVYSPKVGEFGPTDGCGGKGIVSSGNVRLSHATGRTASLTP